MAKFCYKEEMEVTNNVVNRYTLEVEDVIIPFLET